MLDLGRMVTIVRPGANGNHPFEGALPSISSYVKIANFGLSQASESDIWGNFMGETTYDPGIHLFI